MHRLAGALVDGNAGECLRVVGDLAQEGYDLPHVARDFLSHLRDLVVAKVCPEPGGLLDLAEEEIADVKALAERASADDLTRLHQGFSRSFDDIVRGGQPRASLEMTLVRLSRRPALLPVDELLRKIGELERRLAGAGGASSGPGGGGGGGGGGIPHRGGEARPGGPAAQQAPRRPAGQAGGADFGEPPGAGGMPFRPEGSAREPHAGGVARGSSAGGEAPPEAPPSNSIDISSNPVGDHFGEVAPRPSPPSPAPISSNPVGFSQPPSVSAPATSAPPARNLTPQASPLGSAAIPAASPPPRPAAPPPGASPPARPGSSMPARPGYGAGVESRAPAPEARGPSGGALGEGGFAAWRSIVENLRAQNGRIASFYDHAVPLHIDADRIVLGFDADYVFAENAMEGSARDLLIAAARRQFGRAPSITFERAASRSGTIAQAESAEKRAKTDAARHRIAEHPLVTAAIELLGAELKDVRLPQDLAEW
ncbi:MAG: DNA polymerase III subunit gamma/tau, partial [Polyangiaceae bacterium]|nr:DNA polymerase III subunit gamma/tau [Polyangiaceae bacterium]